MAKSILNPKVDWFFTKATRWQEEYNRLRMIVLDCGLTEELKWGCPCYTLEGRNVVLIHGFKDYCALLLMKGSLLGDAKGILIQQTENVQSARQIRFTSVQEIAKMASAVKTYIKEAIDVEKSGLRVPLKKTSQFTMPEELQQALDDAPALKKAFYRLTPGRQRGYLLYFSAAKQSNTRVARVEKYRQHILNGKGLEDK